MQDGAAENGNGAMVVEDVAPAAAAAPAAQPAAQPDQAPVEPLKEPISATFMGTEVEGLFFRHFAVRPVANRSAFGSPGRVLTRVASNTLSNRCSPCLHRVAGLFSLLSRVPHAWHLAAHR